LRQEEMNSDCTVQDDDDSHTVVVDVDDEVMVIVDRETELLANNTKDNVVVDLLEDDHLFCEENLAL
jgi:hypothetical protein